MIHRIMKNWPEKRVKLIVVTDGERVMGLGDLGVQGMGVAAAKTNLYTAAGGLDPSDVLAVCLDVGTNNRELLNDPLYIGNKHERTVGEAYDELLDEFVDAAQSEGIMSTASFFDLLQRKMLLDGFVDALKKRLEENRARLGLDKKGGRKR